MFGREHCNSLWIGGLVSTTVYIPFPHWEWCGELGQRAHTNFRLCVGGFPHLDMPAGKHIQITLSQGQKDSTADPWRAGWTVVSDLVATGVIFTGGHTWAWNYTTSRKLVVALFWRAFQSLCCTLCVEPVATEERFGSWPACQGRIHQ